MTEIVLTSEGAGLLVGGGYVNVVVDHRMWRLAHESYGRPFGGSADRHISLSAGEVDVIARMPEGLIIGETTIRSAVAS